MNQYSRDKLLLAQLQQLSATYNLVISTAIQGVEDQIDRIHTLEQLIEELRDVCTEMGTREMRAEVSKTLKKFGFATIPGYEKV